MRLSLEVREIDEDVGAQLRSFDAPEWFKEGERVAASALTFGVLASASEKVAEGVQNTGASDSERGVG